MPDPSRGRVLTTASLAVLWVLNTALSFVGESTPVSRWGRPVLLLAACVLVWRGHRWARLLLLLLSLGALLAGPIAAAGGMPVLSRPSVILWGVSLATVASLWLLFANADVRGFLSRGSPPAGGGAQALAESGQTARGGRNTGGS